MKATRFILNTDYVTHQNDDEFTLSVSLPSSFTVAAGAVKKFSISKTVAGTASKDYRCYFTSSIHDYAVTGALEAETVFGSDTLYIALERAKNKWTLSVYNLAKTSSHTYSAGSRIITAHIQTFVDPFQL